MPGVKRRITDGEWIEIQRRLKPLASHLYRSLTKLPTVDVDDMAQAAICAVVAKQEEYDPTKDVFAWAAMVGGSAIRDSHKAALAKFTRDAKATRREDARVATLDDLLEAAERIRIQAAQLDGPKRRPGQGGFGDSGRMAIAMLIQYTNWDARKTAKRLSEDPGLVAALGLKRAPSTSTVTWCCGVCLLARKMKKFLK